MDLITFRELENILLTAMKTPTMSIKYVSQETGMPVRTADSPLDCVVDGTGMRLETFGAASFGRRR